MLDFGGVELELELLLLLGGVDFLLDLFEEFLSDSEDLLDLDWGCSQASSE